MAKFVKIGTSHWPNKSPVLAEKSHPVSRSSTVVDITKNNITLHIHPKLWYHPENVHFETEKEKRMNMYDTSNSTR